MFRISWLKIIYFDEQIQKIDNFFEWWSPEVPKTDNFMRPAPRIDNFLAAG